MAIKKSTLEPAVKKAPKAKAIVTAEDVYRHIRSVVNRPIIHVPYITVKHEEYRLNNSVSIRESEPESLQIRKMIEVTNMPNFFAFHHSDKGRIYLAEKYDKAMEKFAAPDDRGTVQM